MDWVFGTHRSTEDFDTAALKDAKALLDELSVRLKLQQPASFDNESFDWIPLKPRPSCRTFLSPSAIELTPSLQRVPVNPQTGLKSVPSIVR